MKIELNLNPDEALALIQVLERDHVFPDVTGPIIRALDEARLDWAHDVRNLAHARELLVNPADIDAWHRWEKKHKVSLRLERIPNPAKDDPFMHPAEPEYFYIPVEDTDDSNVYLLDGEDNLIDLTPQVLKGE